MTRGNLIANAAALLLAGCAFALAAPADGRPVNSDKAACAIAKARVAARDQFPVSRVAFCEVIPVAESPREYYVLALHSGRSCEYICSTNLGWFAVERSSARVFDWDVGDWAVGSEVRSRR